MKNIVLKYGLIISSIFIIIKLNQYSLYNYQFQNEIWLLLVCIIFLIVGIFLYKKVLMPIEKSNEYQLDSIELPNNHRIKNFDISERELEVLNEISKGNSNKQIAENLFLSESTVKTHISNIFVKLNAKRRTEAIKIAKEMEII